MAAERPTHDLAAIRTLMDALAPFARGVVGYGTLEAWAVACADATPDGIGVIAAGHGWLQLTFKDGWPDLRTTAQTERGTPRRARHGWTD